MTPEKTNELIKRIKDSRLQHFDDLAFSLRNTENLSLDLIRKGYQRYCSNLINGALREKDYPNAKSYELLIEISELMNAALRKDCRQYNSATVWRHDWPCTSTVEEDIKVIEWFEHNVGKVLLFPCFMSCYSEKKCLPFQERHFEISTLSEDSNAFDISNLIPNHPEAEVLFGTNTKLKIVNVNKELMTVTLVETIEREHITVNINSAYHDIRSLK